MNRYQQRNGARAVSEGAVRRTGVTAIGQDLVSERRVVIVSADWPLRGDMASPVRDLEAAVMALPRSERARLAERLLASLDEDSEIELAWQAEVRTRLDRYLAGEIEAVSAASVHEEARRRLNR